MAANLQFLNCMKQMCLILITMISMLGSPLALSANEIAPSLTRIQKPTIDQDKLKQLVRERALEKKLLKGSIRYRVGGNSGGGGDEDGLDFQRTALQALKGLETNLPEVYETLRPLELENYIDAMSVLVIEEEIDVEAQEFFQNSIAVNFPDSLTIILSRPRWKSVQDQGLREGIALHEILSLARIESTGNYTISAKYASTLGTTMTSLKNLDDSTSLYFSLYEEMKLNFDQSVSSISLKDLQEASHYRKSACTWIVKPDHQAHPGAPVLGSAKLKQSAVKVSMFIGVSPDGLFMDLETVKTPSGNFVFKTRDIAPDSYTDRITEVRKNKDRLAFKWIEKSTKGNGETSKSTAYGYCHAVHSNN